MGEFLHEGNRKERVKAQAFLHLSKLCLIGFINRDPGIMLPLPVGIFLKAVGLVDFASKLPADPQTRCVWQVASAAYFDMARASLI